MKPPLYLSLSKWLTTLPRYHFATYPSKCDRVFTDRPRIQKQEKTIVSLQRKFNIYRSKHTKMYRPRKAARRTAATLGRIRKAIGAMHRAQLKQKSEECETQLKCLTKVHDEEKKKLTAERDEKIEELSTTEETQKAEISALKKDHSKEIGRVEAERVEADRKIKDLTKAHDKSIEELKSAQCSIETLKERASGQANTIASYQKEATQYQKDSTNALAEQESHLNALQQRIVAQEQDLESKSLSLQTLECARDVQMEKVEMLQPYLEEMEGIIEQHVSLDMNLRDPAILAECLLRALVASQTRVAELKATQDVARSHSSSSEHSSADAVMDIDQASHLQSQDQANVAELEELRKKNELLTKENERLTQKERRLSSMADKSIEKHDLFNLVKLEAEEDMEMAQDDSPAAPLTPQSLDLAEATSSPQLSSTAATPMSAPNQKQKQSSAQKLRDEIIKKSKATAPLGQPTNRRHNGSDAVLGIHSSSAISKPAKKQSRRQRAAAFQSALARQPNASTLLPPTKDQSDLRSRVEGPSPGLAKALREDRQIDSKTYFLNTMSDALGLPKIKAEAVKKDKRPEFSTAIEAYQNERYEDMTAAHQFGRMIWGENDTRFVYFTNYPEKRLSLQVELPKKHVLAANPYLPFKSGVDNKDSATEANHYYRCIFSHDPELHMKAVEKAAMSPGSRMTEELVEEFRARLVENHSETLEESLDAEEEPELWEETATILSELPQFLTAVEAWVDDAECSGEWCWPPTFHDEELRKKTAIVPGVYVQDKLPEVSTLADQCQKIGDFEDVDGMSALISSLGGSTGGSSAMFGDKSGTQLNGAGRRN